MSSPSKCANCREKIIDDGRHMSCVDCKNSYHVGKLCSGIADSTFKTMGAAKREIWRCRRCREQSREPGSQSETGLSQWESPVTGEHFRSLESKLDCLTSLKANVDSLLSLPAKIDQLLTLKPVVENLKSAQTEIQKSVDFLSESYDSLLLTATANASSVTELRNETTSLREIVTEQSKTIEHLQDELNDSDQTQGPLVLVSTAELTRLLERYFRNPVRQLGVAAHSVDIQQGTDLRLFTSLIDRRVAVVIEVLDVTDDLTGIRIVIITDDVISYVTDDVTGIRIVIITDYVISDVTDDVTDIRIVIIADDVTDDIIGIVT
ncbi:uncharacterized protein ISCGN_028817 [Ixodes scapularis]